MGLYFENTCIKCSHHIGFGTCCLQQGPQKTKKTDTRRGRHKTYKCISSFAFDTYLFLFWGLLSRLRISNSTSKNPRLETKIKPPLRWLMCHVIFCFFQTDDEAAAEKADKRRGTTETKRLRVIPRRRANRVRFMFCLGGTGEHFSRLSHFTLKTVNGHSNTAQQQRHNCVPREVRHLRRFPLR